MSTLTFLAGEFLPFWSLKPGFCPETESLSLILRKGTPQFIRIYPLYNTITKQNTQRNQHKKICDTINKSKQQNNFITKSSTKSTKHKKPTSNTKKKNITKSKQFSQAASTHPSPQFNKKSNTKNLKQQTKSINIYEIVNKHIYSINNDKSRTKDYNHIFNIILLWPSKFPQLIFLLVINLFAKNWGKNQKLSFFFHGWCWVCFRPASPCVRIDGAIRVTQTSYLYTVDGGNPSNYSTL